MIPLENGCMAEVRVGLEPEAALPPGSRPLSGGVILRVLEPRAYVRLQVARRHISEAASIRIHDVPLPTAANRCHGDDPAVLWTAPDGWLLTSQELAGDELREIVRIACGKRTAAAVDASDALVTLEVSGPQARELLARGTGIDLAANAFGPGQCARTRLAQLAVIVRPRHDSMLELIVDRAPAAWLCNWLADASVALSKENFE